MTLTVIVLFLERLCNNTVHIQKHKSKSGVSTTKKKEEVNKNNAV